MNACILRTRQSTIRMDLLRPGRCIRSNYDAGSPIADTRVTEVRRREMAYLDVHSLDS
jgi:hypothetical protein